MLNKLIIPITVLVALLALYGMITGQWMISILFITLAVVLVALWHYWQ